MSIRSVVPPMPAGQVEQRLFVLRSADMTLTTDQAFTKSFTGNNYIVTNIISVLKTGAFGIACVGGIYTGAGKTGDAVLAATQSWATLTGAGTSAIANLANLLQVKVETATPNLSLTTGNTGALTADFFIIGVVVD